MGIEEAAIALAIVGAATSAYAATEQNQAARRSARAANAAADVKTKQVGDQAALERLKTANQLAQIRGRLAVSAASAGVGLGGSFDALEEQASLDANLNTSIINQNQVNETAAVRSGLNSDLASIGSHMTSTVLAGFSGGISGAETGLKIGSYFEGTPTATSRASGGGGGGVNTYGVGARGDG